MRWFINYFLKNTEKIAHFSVLIGIAAGGISCAASESICHETIMSAKPVALLINLIASLYIFRKRDMKTINRTELLQQYQAGDITTTNMLKEYGGLMAGLCVLLFWAGWFIFGVLATLLTI